MIVVADTSPLNYLVRSGYVWILPELFGKVVVPNAVLTEMQHPRAPGDVQAFSGSPPAWLECVEVSRVDGGLDSSFLGDGEREAISLALQIHADALLIDDLAGRKEAQSRGIAARGTLAILLQASLRGHLDLPAAFNQLRQLGFRASRALQEELFDLYRQGQPG
jgi:predicted nucleic acid-binding protein